MPKALSRFIMLAERVLAFIREHHMFAEGDLLLVGVSGGPDSICLLHSLLEIREALGIRLHVAHLDHALRPDSAADARFVAELAAKWGLPCTIERRDVEEFRAHYHLSLEEAGRQVRYAFFGRLARELGAVGVAVGHTADDQVETILLHWLRGAGMAGLRGMQPITRYRIPRSGEQINIFHPLLSVRRSETEAYCAALGLQPRADPSNLSLRYMRNRIRFRLLPILESYNSNIREGLLRTARIVGRDYAFLEGRVAEAWPRVASEGPGLVTLDIAAALALPPAILYHLLRRAVEKVAGSAAGLEWVHLEEMAAALKKPAGTALTLPNGLLLAVGYGDCTISVGQIPCPLPMIAGHVLLSIPGETRFSGWHVQAQVEEEGPFVLEEDPWGAVLDLEQAGPRLRVRRRRAGDRFQPLGMTQEKRLQDFLVDAKVPRSWRSRVPLIVSPSQIVWVAGWRIDDRVKVTQNTRRALRLRFTLVPKASAPESL
ncbi:MAG: tRNA lysidine(34) synthetase TilS [Dehalococcoidia bacterium]|nr:tRNA lysidine(34) synthetase TilS [Dehalococcoidia bacterium]